MEPLTFAVAIPVNDEAQNIVALLQRVVTTGAVRVLVVSDGSTDGTNALVERFAEQSPVPVILQATSERPGKADAVNRILTATADVDLVAMVSGDAMPDLGCIERLVAAFDDPTVGVAAGRPLPQGPPGLPVVEVSRLLWSLHHRIARTSPKSTEITVFRNVLSRIDPNSLTDEAAIEAAVTARGYRVVYVPEATILTNVPLTVRDYMDQRTRVTLGHLMLAREGYGVGTLSMRQRFRALRQVWDEEGVAPRTLVLATALEVGVYAIALWRLHFRPRPSGVWSPSGSTKRAFR